MTQDPGTIYSDDEIECFSDDDEEEDAEIARQRLSVPNQDIFYDGLFDGKPSDEVFDKLALSGLKKYLNNKKIHDIDSTIERVRAEHIKKKAKRVDDECSSDDGEGQMNEITNLKTELKENIKVREKDVKKKEKKKERMVKEIEHKLQKEKVELSFEDVPSTQSNITFLEMNLSTPMLKAIANMGYQHPTPIQSMTIPIALKGRDICGCAATGTGKTAAFMLPILQRLIFRPSKDAVTRVLVLVPTRELGVQVFEVSRELAQYSSVNISLTVGGLNMNTQTEELLQSPDIIIATPGRLIDHIHNTPSFSLKEIEILVLDEADRMLDEFFAEQLAEIVRQCSVTRQTMLFSATMTDKVKDLVAVSLKNPVRVFVNNNTDVAQNLRQEFVRLHKKAQKYRLSVLTYLLTHHFKEECLVFIPKRNECHKMHIIFGLLGLKCGELHGNMKQNERLSSLQKFKDKAVNVLFATDVAARGLDIKGVKTVVNYTVPTSYEMYVHRVGRTARAGFSGRSVTISYDSGDDYTMLRKIQKNSLSPLYERLISRKNIDKCCLKLENIYSSMEKVLLLEVEEKKMQGATQSIEKLQTIVKEDKRHRRPTRVWFQTPEQINKEKERLKLIIAGKAPRKRPSKQDKIQLQSPEQKPKKRKNKKECEINSIVDVGSAVKRKSNFEKELTLTNSRSIKKLRKGPFEERKKDFRKNEDKKFNANDRFRK